MARINVIIPTSINMINVIHENIVANLVRGRSSDIELPGLYRRAFLIVYETAEISIGQVEGGT